MGDSDAALSLERASCRGAGAHWGEGGGRSRGASPLRWKADWRAPPSVLLLWVCVSRVIADSPPTHMPSGLAVLLQASRVEQDQHPPGTPDPRFAGCFCGGYRSLSPSGESGVGLQRKAGCMAWCLGGRWVGLVEGQ